jgi:hypothetical protein
LAIWQFHIYFIPRQSLVDKYGHIPRQLEMDKESWSDYFKNSDLDTDPDFEDALTIHWWLNLNLNADDFFALLQQFGDVQEWTASTDSLRSFGDTETNDISVCFDSRTNKVQELSCRLDLRDIDRDFIDKVLSIATKFDCLLMDRQGRFFEPTIKALAETIQLSNARRFVTDPRQFLEDLSHGIVTPQ